MLHYCLLQPTQCVLYLQSPSFDLLTIDLNWTAITSLADLRVYRGQSVYRVSLVAIALAMGNRVLTYGLLLAVVSEQAGQYPLQIRGEIPPDLRLPFTSHLSAVA